MPTLSPPTACLYSTVFTPSKTVSWYRFFTDVDAVALEENLRSMTSLPQMVTPAGRPM
jgi:hypothetical protein